MSSRYHQQAEKKHVAASYRRLARVVREVRLYAIVLAIVGLAAAVLLFNAHLPSSATGAQQASSSSGPKAGGGTGRPVTGHKGSATCGQPGYALCPTPDAGWVSVRSEQPADILAAAMSTTMYRNEVSNRGASTISSLAAPVLVLPYGAHTGTAYFDDAHFIIRSFDRASHPSGQFDFIYDRTNHRISFSSFGVANPGDPYYARPFPSLVTKSEAISALQTKRGVAVRASFAPELVFFPPDPRLSPTNSSSPLTWSGGGYDPSLPMWLLQGADGVDYFVGINSYVYTAKDIPIDPHQGAH